MTKKNAATKSEFPQFVVSEKESGERLDKFLQGKLKDFSRTDIQKLIADGAVLAGGSVAKKNLRLNEGVAVTLSALPEKESSELKPNQSVTVFEEAMNTLSSKGVEKDKLVPVVLFYSKSFTGAKGLGEAQTGIGSGNEGILSYKELMAKFDTPDYQVTFDEASKSEVAVSDMESIVFMGIPSVKALAETVKNEGYAGVAAYDLSQDHTEPIVSLLVTIGLELRPDVNYKPKKK